MKVYVAGAYSAPSRSGRLTNVYKAIDAGYAIMKTGHTVFIPHLTHFVEEHALLTGQQDELAWEFWLAQDLPWLDCCDAVLKLSSSRGADVEELRALEDGKPVYYSLEEALASLNKMEVAV